MLTKMIDGVAKLRDGLGSLFAPADYSELISRGRYYLSISRPDLAQGTFMETIKKEPHNPDPWYFYAVSLLEQDRMKSQSLEERVWWEHNGTTYRDHVRLAYRKVAELSPSAENYFDAAMLAIHLKELKVAKSYLASAIGANPDNHLLIKLGRITTTLKAEELTARVKELLEQKEWAVHLYPL